MLLTNFDFEKYTKKFIEINKKIKQSSMNNIIDFINENKEIKVGEFIDILSKNFDKLKIIL
jgi:energy-converting hydrogenase A subunit M